MTVVSDLIAKRTLPNRVSGFADPCVRVGENGVAATVLSECAPHSRQGSYFYFFIIDLFNVLCESMTMENERSSSFSGSNIRFFKRKWSCKYKG
jgi:hypothetical protein